MPFLSICACASVCASASSRIAAAASYTNARGSSSFVSQFAWTERARSWPGHLLQSILSASKCTKLHSHTHNFSQTLPSLRSPSNSEKMDSPDVSVRLLFTFGRHNHFSWIGRTECKWFGLSKRGYFVRLSGLVCWDQHRHRRSSSPSSSS